MPISKHPGPSVHSLTVNEDSGQNGNNILIQDDIAGQFLARLGADITGTQITTKEMRKVLWKIDLIVLPLISCTVILSAVDKVIISNAAIMGMKTDLHLAGNQYSWLGSIFYFGYLAADFPTAYFIQKLPVAKLLSGMIFAWAVLLFCSAATHNFGGIAVVRFIMGCMEAGAFPICSILTVMWYTNKEQPIRVSIWYNQFSSIFAGIVSYGIAETNLTLARWRLLFIVLGAFSALYSLLLLAVLPDSPVSAWFLSRRERYICVRRVQANNTGIEDKKIKWYQVKECLLDPKAWLLSLFACAQNIPSGGLVTFAAIIVSGLGYTTQITTLLGIPTGVVATMWQMVLAVPCAYLKNRRCLVIATANVVPIACAVLMWKLPRTNKHGLLASYYTFYTYWGPYVMSTSVPMANVSGHSKKVTMNAMYFISYCIGNIIGPQLFQASDAPNYPKAYIGILVCFIVSSASISLYGLLCSFENNKREKVMTNPSEMVFNGGEEFADKTDKEKCDFRYTY